ncbi:MAG: sensor histidine kinase, partial [Terrimicrobiaceae bacterium]
LRDTSEFYRSLVKQGPDGRYHLSGTNVHEDFWGVQDSIMDLAAIRGTVPLAIRAAEILEQDDDPAVRKKFLGNIVLEVDRLSAIATNFLALSRIESEPIDPAARASLPEVANSVADVFRARAQAIAFESQISDSPCWIAMPPDQLRRIIEALLENAFQFTPAGKKVFLTTFGASFTVRDEGPGIPDELQSKIFDRFFTTVNPSTGRRGTGLGLAIVKSLAARYHARISLESIAGTGTSVTVYFEEIPPIS